MIIAKVNKQMVIILADLTMLSCLQYQIDQSKFTQFEAKLIRIENFQIIRFMTIMVLLIYLIIEMAIQIDSKVTQQVSQIRINHLGLVIDPKYCLNFQTILLMFIITNFPNLINLKWATYSIQFRTNYYPMVIDPIKQYQLVVLKVIDQKDQLVTLQTMSKHCQISYFRQKHLN